MIARIWHGWTTPDNADAYQRLLTGEILPSIERASGIKAEFLRRDGKFEVEFITILRFKNLDEVKRFAGDDYTHAVVKPEAEALLKRFCDRVRHYRAIEWS